VTLDGYLPVVTNVMVPGSSRLGARGEPFLVQIALTPQVLPVPGSDWSGSTIFHLGLKLKWIGPFWAGLTEITRRQFEAFTRSPGSGGLVCVTANGWRVMPDRSWRNPGFPQSDDHPVVGATWHEATAFCEWLTRQDRAARVIRATQTYRLPTDTEFTLMARGFTGGVKRGNYAGAEVRLGEWNPYWEVLTDSAQREHEDGFQRTAPVGEVKTWQTPSGLFDLGGNVEEWCADWYVRTLNTPDILQQIPLLNDDGDGRTYKVTRGGSWFDEQPADVAIDTRHRFKPEERHDRIGFRIVLVDAATP
jgi:formylglycine-generating enzyme required for sulfatase activity